MATIVMFSNTAIAASVIDDEAEAQVAFADVMRGQGEMSRFTTAAEREAVWYNVNFDIRTLKRTQDLYGAFKHLTDLPDDADAATIADHTHEFTKMMSKWASNIAGGSHGLIMEARVINHRQYCAKVLSMLFERPFRSRRVQDQFLSKWQDEIQEMQASIRLRSHHTREKIEKYKADAVVTEVGTTAILGLITSLLSYDWTSNPFFASGVGLAVFVASLDFVRKVVPATISRRRTVRQHMVYEMYKAIDDTLSGKPVTCREFLSLAKKNSSLTN